jgi:hypothetical protein
VDVDSLQWTQQTHWHVRLSLESQLLPLLHLLLLLAGARWWARPLLTPTPICPCWQLLGVDGLLNYRKLKPLLLLLLLLLMCRPGQVIAIITKWLLVFPVLQQTSMAQGCDRRIRKWLQIPPFWLRFW